MVILKGTDTHTTRLNKPVRVHIIDDDHDDREILCEILSAIDPGIHLDQSISCEEALAFLCAAGNTPDVILLDLNLPKINGLECLEILKADEYLRSIPVQIYTTSSGTREIKECLSRGAAGFITKTSDLHELRGKMQMMLTALKKQ